MRQLPANTGYQPRRYFVENSQPLYGKNCGEAEKNNPRIS